MFTRVCRALVLTGALVFSTACWGTPPPEIPGGPFVVDLIANDAGTPAALLLRGWSSAELSALRRTPAATGAAELPGVSLRVAGADTSVAATYIVTDTGLEIRPAFPLERAREYEVIIDTARMPEPRPDGRLALPVHTPPAPSSEPVRVSAIFPSADVWPENTLRFYLHFSGPMSGTSTVGRVRLVDERGEVIPDVLLDVDVDLWNTDYTRRTVFFDPGRVKRDIRPNRELGRGLVAGRRYAIVVDEAWTDAGGRPLAAEFRHTFTAGHAVERGIELEDWSVTAPAAGSTSPLVVAFPWALDEGLLHRAVGVTTTSGDAVDGTITMADHERRWMFTPAVPWSTQTYHLVVLSVLEDPSGNTVGEAFEFEMFGKPAAAAPERVTLPFTPRRQ